MKTNNISGIIIHCFSFFLLIVFFCSCSDELTEHPKTIVVENFYKTTEEVETATNAIYGPLRGGQMAVYEATLECLSDFVYGRGSWTQIGAFQKLNDTNITRVSGIWNIFYQSIRCANLVIQNSPTNNADAAVYVAEAKFLRAFAYFHLVRNWGGVPIRTESNMSETAVPKSTKEEVYNFIVSDLLEAEKVLPEKRDEFGRPSKWAVKTLLSDVYLQLEKYSEARAKAEEVINSGAFALVPISSKEDFQNNVFGPTLISTTEEIFYLKYSDIISGQGNYMLWILNHAKTGGFPFGGAYAIYGNLSNPIYVNWNNNDYRKQLWSPVEFGLGPNTLVSTKFIDHNAISQNGGANDDPIYGYSDLLLNYAESSTLENNIVTSKGLEALNQVHRRAYGYNPTEKSDIDYDASDYNSVSDFVDLVIKERGYEFQVEGKRWLELKRTGKAKQIIKETKGIDISDDCLLWPIPVNEMNYNTALDPSKDQNPGY